MRESSERLAVKVALPFACLINGGSLYAKGHYLLEHAYVVIMTHALADKVLISLFFIGFISFIFYLFIYYYYYYYYFCWIKLDSYLIKACMKSAAESILDLIWSIQKQTRGTDQYRNHI